MKHQRILLFAGALALWGGGFALTRCNLPGGPARFLPLLPLLAAWLLAGYPVLGRALRSLPFFRGPDHRFQGLDENFLMTLATLGAFAVGEWEEAAGVMIFYMIGELIQDAAVEKSRASIKSLLALKPDTARTRAADDWVEGPAAAVEPGTLIQVRPGERIPLDGVVVEGAASVDASILTGESLPQSRSAGDEVRSGTVSLDGVLVIRTTRTADDSSAARIIRLVEEAREAKAKPERFITAFARRYTPLVVAAAALIALVPPLFLPGHPFGEWIYRALILLVISCPCALVVSIPLGYFAGIGGMSRRGIMVKGASHLDTLYRVKNLAFDKTGTLTQGAFSIRALEPAFVGPEREAAERRLLETALLAEGGSNHPIAEALKKGALERGVSLPPFQAEAFREIPGEGLELAAAGETILAGNRKLLEKRGVPLPPVPEDEPHTPVYVARGGVFLGRILIGDSLREGAAGAIRELKTLGVSDMVIFTGDTQASAREAARSLGIPRSEGALLPGDKLRELEKLLQTGITAFVGDGINDAPVLARSDLGIAVGSGADAAVEAADIIIMTSDPRRLPEAIRRARKTRRIILENTVFALAAKVLFITLAVLGMANMWLALAADVGVALVAILNAARALR